MTNPLLLLCVVIGASRPTLAFQTASRSHGSISSIITRHICISRTLHHSRSIHTIVLQATLSGWINPSSITTPSSSSSTTLPPSPVETLLIRDRLIHVKQDDRLHLPRSNVGGNKARKFHALNEIPAVDFPDAVVSYGGPQSNAMVALAAIVCSKNRELSAKKKIRDDVGRNDDDRNDNHAEMDAMEDDIRIESRERDDFAECPSTDDGAASAAVDSTTLDGNKSQPQQSRKQFIYYTKTIPRYLKNNPNGNFMRALALGMEIRTLSPETYSRLFGGLHGGSVMAPADLEIPVPGRSLWMPQGGACGLASLGSDILGKEIVDFWTENGKGVDLAVCLPGGTCTTALLLHRSIQKLLLLRQECRNDDGRESIRLDSIRVVVIPCVGDHEYAQRQMIQLDKSLGGKGDPNDLPWILRPRSDVDYGTARRRANGYFPFGQPSAAILETFDSLNGEGLNLDLVYGAPAFSLLLQHWKIRDDVSCPIAGRQIMYVHSGGLEGISSQLTRYKHNGLLEGREIMA